VLKLELDTTLPVLIDGRNFDDCCGCANNPRDDRLLFLLAVVAEVVAVVVVVLAIPDLGLADEGLLFVAVVPGWALPRSARDIFVDGDGDADGDDVDDDAIPVPSPPPVVASSV
jgi:hypothetical protein